MLTMLTWMSCFQSIQLRGSISISCITSYLENFQALPSSSHLSLSSCRSRLSLPGSSFSKRNCASMTGECRACKMHWANFKAASSAVKTMTRLRLCHDMCHPVCHSLAFWKISSTIISLSQVTLTLVIFLTSIRPPASSCPTLLELPLPALSARGKISPPAWKVKASSAIRKKDHPQIKEKLARFQSWPSGVIHSLQPI